MRNDGGFTEPARAELGSPTVPARRTRFGGPDGPLQNRRWWAIAIGAAMFGLALIPWERAVWGAGWMHAARQEIVYSPLAGRLVTLPKAGPVSAGDPMFGLESADIRLPGGHSAAPFTGTLTDIDPALAAGVLVQPRQPLATLIDPASWVVEAFIAEAEIARIEVGQAARLHTGTGGLGFLRGRVAEVDGSRTLVLPDRMLDAQAGGPIVTRAPQPGDAHDAAQPPRDALYRVRIALDESPGGDQAALGRVVIDADARAWLPAKLARIASLFGDEAEL